MSQPWYAQYPMPPGWEMKYDFTNKRYFYIDHANKVTSWDDPRQKYYAAGTAAAAATAAAVPQQPTAARLSPRPVSPRPAQQQQQQHHQQQQQQHHHRQQQRSRRPSSSSDDRNSFTVEVAADDYELTRLQLRFPNDDVGKLRQALAACHSNVDAATKWLNDAKAAEEAKRHEAQLLVKAKNLQFEFPTCNVDVIKDLLGQPGSSVPKVKAQLASMGYSSSGSAGASSSSRPNPPSSSNSSHPPPKAAAQHQQSQRTNEEEDLATKVDCLLESFPSVSKAQIRRTLLSCQSRMYETRQELKKLVSNNATGGPAANSGEGSHASKASAAASAAAAAKEAEERQRNARQAAEAEAETRREALVDQMMAEFPGVASVIGVTELIKRHSGDAAKVRAALAAEASAATSAPAASSSAGAAAASAGSADPPTKPKQSNDPQPKSKPKKAAAAASSTASGSCHGNRIGPDPSLRLGPDPELHVGPDPGMRSGPDLSLAKGPDPALLLAH